MKFEGLSIADVLDMTVEDAVEFFKAVLPIRDRMATLQEVGLGYVKIGQQATTLSGGEAQRVKLAKELSRRATGQTLYILDEPTTGLHFEGVRKLLEVLHQLVEQGTPWWRQGRGDRGAGDAGGVAKAAGSFTGRYLLPLLDKQAETGG